MQAPRGLFLLSLALCALSAHATIGGGQDGGPLDFVQGIPQGFELSAAMDAYGAQGAGAGQGLGAKIHQGIDGMKDSKREALGGLAQAGLGAVQAVGSGVQNLAGAVGDRVQDTVQGAQLLAGLVGNRVQDKYENVQALGGRVVDGVQGAAGAIGSGVQNLAGAVGDRVVDKFQGAQALAGAVGNRVQDRFEDAQAAAGAINARVIGGVQDAASKAANAAGAIVQGVTAIPGAVAGAVGDAREAFADARADAAAAIRDDLGLVRGVASEVGKLAQAARPIVPPITQAWNPAAWKESYSQYGPQFSAAYSTLYDTLEAVAEGISARYCTEAKFTPKTKKPAKFTGPGFSLTFFSGSCELDEEAALLNKTKQINCIKPAVFYTKTAANFTSKYKAAPRFVNKECKVTKTFGEPSTTVLYVFDGVDTAVANITSRVSSELRSVLSGARLGTAQVTQQLQAFLSGLPGLLPGKGGNRLGGLGAGLPNLDILGALGNLGGATPPVVPSPGAGAGGDPFEALKAVLSTYPSMTSS